MATMGTINCGYNLYDLYTHKSPNDNYSINKTIYKKDIVSQVLDTYFSAVCGFLGGSIIGLVWPVTYCVVGANIYYYNYVKPKQLEEKEKV
jgi:hypothetical protein